MSRYCPIYKRNVVYLNCLECDTKECREIPNLRNKNIDIIKTEEELTK